MDQSQNPYGEIACDILNLLSAAANQKEKKKWLSRTEILFPQWQIHFVAHIYPFCIVAGSEVYYRYTSSGWYQNINTCH